jgi:triosephosphate isomerase
MSRKKVAGNWKMNLDKSQAKELVDALSGYGEYPENVEVIIAPPAIYLDKLGEADLGKVKLSAQNVSQHGSGAYTGEISATMLKTCGVEYCLVGHSERRSYYGETDAMVGVKVKALLAMGIKPIFCCGESLEQRESGKFKAVVAGQIETALFDLSESEFGQVIVAYEPVWAIGTGLTASSEQAQEMHAAIRKQIESKFGNSAASQCSILYGGSCKPSNADELFACEDVDGGLIGGAALNAEDFISIINANS